MQGVWVFKEPLYQLPVMNEQIFKSIKRKLKHHPSLKEIIKMTDDERRELDVWAATELEQVNHVCRALPLYNYKIEVENADDIGVGDIINVKITLTRENLKEGEEAGFIHSNTYPYLRKDNIAGMVTDLKEDKYFMGYFKIQGQTRVVVHDFKMWAPFHPQKLELAFHFYSDCYMDSYYREEVIINVLGLDQIKGIVKP